MSIPVQVNTIAPASSNMSKTIFADPKAHDAICDTIKSAMTTRGVSETVASGIIEELKTKLTAVITGFIPGIANLLKDADAPKKPTGSYLYFANDTRDYYKNLYSDPEREQELIGILQHLHDEDQKTAKDDQKEDFVYEKTPANFVKYIAKVQGYVWSTMTDDDKKRYVDMAAADKTRYENDMKTYTPASIEAKIAAPINNKVSRPRKPADPSKPKKDPNAPKMPKNEFLMWYDDVKTQDQWAAYKAQIDAVGGRQRVSKVSELYKSLTPDWKQYYASLRNGAMLKYKQDSGAYAATQTAPQIQAPITSVMVGGINVSTPTPYEQKHESDELESAEEDSGDTTQPVQEDLQPTPSQAEYETFPLTPSQTHVRVLPSFKPLNQQQQLLARMNNLTKSTKPTN